jgi:UDP-3-O-[3-hydroxymyristoyl] N-acetylglucosamine deacetylase
MKQTTIENSISCLGHGLHTNQKVKVTLKAAPANYGIKFKRVDLQEHNLIDAHFSTVKQSPLNTTIINEHGVSVSTIEHLMAALWGCKIDNCLVEIDNLEMPIMDGSSEHFVFMLESAGVRTLDERRKYIKIKNKIRVGDEKSYLEIEPYDHLTMEVAIKYDNKIIGLQKFSFDKYISFKHELSRARTFCLETEVEYMWSKGLAKGGSLDNALVVGEDKIVNKDGLRYQDEFIRHKLLDCLGDLYLAGAPILAKIKGFCIGHSMNNQLLRQIFNDDNNWEYC